MKRIELLETLNLLKPGLGNNDLVPIFGSYCFGDDTATAYNDNLAIVAPCETDLTAAIAGEVLLGLLSNSKAKEAAFEISDNEIAIKRGKSRIKLPCFDREEFIFEEPGVVETGAHEWHATMDLEQAFLTGLECCLVTASQDQAMPALMGVTLADVEHDYTLFSCDADAVSEFPLPGGFEELTQTYTMPIAFCQVVLRIAEKTQCIEGMIGVNEEWAVVSFSNDYSVYGRIIKQDKPLDYPKLIDDSIGDDPIWVPIPSQLFGGLSRAVIMADKETHKTRLTIESGKIKLYTESSAGLIRDSFKLKGHPDVDALVDAESLLRSLKLCNEMAINQDCSAFRHRADGDDKDTLTQVIGNLDA